MPGIFLKLADLLYSFTYLCKFPEMTITSYYYAGSGSLFSMLTIILYICETARC